MDGLSVALISAMVGAFLGGWLGFFLAARRDDCLRTVDIALHIIGGEFSKNRINMLSEISGSGADLGAIADRENDETFPVRNSAFEVLNTYELVCDLRKRNLLDKGMFEEHLRKIIEDDYTALNDFLEAVEEYQKQLQGDGVFRPYFPKIKHVVGRRINAN